MVPRTSKLRVGVIGLGVGARHIDGFSTHAGCEVVALCDQLSEKRAEFATRYPEMRVVESSHDILTDPSIDVVSIASYDADHAPQVLTALAHHKHVFVEKPLCLYIEEAQQIRAALQSQPHLKLSAHFPLRTTPRFQELQRLVGAGELGRLYYTEADYNYGRLEKITTGWRAEAKHYSVVLAGGIHMIDLLLTLHAARVEEVFAYGNKLVSLGTPFRFRDFVVALLTFSDGSIAKVACNFGCVFPHFNSLTMWGTKATFSNGLPPDIQGRLYTSRDPARPPQTVTASYRQEKQQDSNPLFGSFIEAVIADREPLVTPAEIFAALAVCFAIERSLASTRPERVQTI